MVFAMLNIAGREKYLLSFRTLSVILGFMPLLVFANVTINSPLGTRVVFSEKKSGENYDAYAWGKLIFKGSGDEIVDLGIRDRYFTEDGSSKVSPSGRYLVVSSVSGGYLYNENEPKKYVDRAYCSVVDMKNGCYISDWRGEACGYDWKKDEDVLENSSGTDTFDFLSFKPAIKNVDDKLALLNNKNIKMYLICDAPNSKNINTYQKLIKLNPNAKLIARESILAYLNSIVYNGKVSSKAYLFDSPENSSLTKSYLVPDDRIKIIQKSSDGEWINIGYIGKNNIPLIAWVKVGSVDVLK